MSKSQSITLRVSVNDLDAVRKLAAEQGLPYQTLIKAILHQALSRESRESARASGQTTEENHTEEIV